MFGIPKFFLDAIEIQDREKFDEFVNSCDDIDKKWARARRDPNLRAAVKQYEHEQLMEAIRSLWLKTGGA